MPDPRSRAEGTSREETRDAGRPNPRPRFTLKSKLAPTEIRKRVNAMIQSSPRVRGIAFDHRIEIAIDGDEHHFWSPQLVIDVKAEEGGAELEARFGPDPYVWALYLLSYGGLLVLTFFASMFGIAQLLIDQTPTAFFVAPVAGVLAGLVYGASFVGQGLGGEQMYFLRASITKIVEEDSEPEGPQG
jgi:hypothetical protein